MLISERKVDESILIGDEIVIKVLRVRSGRASIGVEAPRHIDVVRKELEGHKFPQAPARGVNTSKGNEKIS